MISSAVYRFRAIPPPFVGWNPNSRSDLVYRGQVTIELQSPGVVQIENSVLNVSTTAIGSSTHGGTIAIATPRKVVIEGSELRTNAAAGSGGTINITATKKVVEDATSVISATSATGPNGSVTITAPKTILNGVVEP
jgi:hypothetical protein